MMTEYYIPTAPSETEFTEKRSRFIGHVWRVESETEARAHVEEMKKRYYDARHNCWCYRLREGGVERYSDDGEPQGTAGQPMLNVFQRENVNDVVCVVTRYFGGILLGAGGLVRAYSAAAKDALDGAGISVVRRWVAMEVPCTYAQFEGMRREIGSFGGVVEAVDYGVDVVLSALLPEERAEAFSARLTELAASESAIPGLSTGLTDLDRAISGLNKSDLILLAARPGMGKTSMALNILLEAGKKSGKNVAFFSLEMSREQLALRLISSECFVDNKKLVTGKLTEEDWEKVAVAADSLNRSRIFIDDDSSVSVADISAKCRRMDNLGLVIIDYLQLMQSAGGRTYSGENRQQVVSDISRALKIMAKELDVPVLCLSQLSRANESRSDKRPMLSDLRESGAIEQDADIVMFLYREGYYDKDTPNPNLAECIIAKNRHGETRTVELQWLPEFTTFGNMEWQHDEY